MRDFVKKCDCVHGYLVLRQGGYYKCECCGVVNGDSNLNTKQKELNDKK